MRKTKLLFLILFAFIIVPNVNAQFEPIHEIAITQTGVHRVMAHYEGTKDVYVKILYPDFYETDYIALIEIGTTDTWYYDFDFNETGVFVFNIFYGTPYNHISAISYHIIDNSLQSAIWDAYLVNHTIDGTFGELIQEINGTLILHNQTIVDRILSLETTLGNVNNTIVNMLLSNNNTLLAVNETIYMAISDIPDEVWDEILGEHTLSGSTGQALFNVTQLNLNTTEIVDMLESLNITISDTIVNMLVSHNNTLLSVNETIYIAIDDIPDEVWDVPLNNHTLSGSTGQALFNITQLNLNTTDIVDMLETLNITLSMLNTTQIVDMLIDLNVTLSSLNTTQLVSLIGDVPDNVWDVYLVNHTIVGTTGIAVQTTYQFSGSSAMEFEIHTVSEYHSNMQGMIVLMIKYADIPISGVVASADFYYPNNTIWMSDQPFVEIDSTAIYVCNFDIPEDAVQGVYKANVEGVYSVGGTYINDTFTEPDGVPDNWNLASGTWAIVDNKLNHTQHGTYAWTHWNDVDSADWTNYRLEAMVFPWTSQANNMYGVMARYNSRSEVYLFYVASYNNQLRLDKGYSTLISKSFDIPDEQWYNFTMIVNGGNIKCYLNDTLEFDYTDISYIESGSAGFYTPSYVSYDNFTLSIAGQDTYSYTVKDFKIDDAILGAGDSGGGMSLAVGLIMLIAVIGYILMKKR